MKITLKRLASANPAAEPYGKEKVVVDDLIFGGLKKEPFVVDSTGKIMLLETLASIYSFPKGSAIVKYMADHNGIKIQTHDNDMTNLTQADLSGYNLGGVKPKK